MPDEDKENPLKDKRKIIPISKKGNKRVKVPIERYPRELNEVNKELIDSRKLRSKKRSK